MLWNHCSGLSFQLWRLQVYLPTIKRKEKTKKNPLHLKEMCLLVTVAMGTTNSHVIYSYHLSHCVALLAVLPPCSPLSFLLHSFHPLSTKRICSNSFQVSMIWRSDILSMKLTSARRDFTGKVLQEEEFFLGNWMVSER